MATPDDGEKHETWAGSATEQSAVTDAIQSINGAKFENWYRNQEYRQNIRDGKPYFNGPSSVPPPQRHSPSSLLKCHRKVVYQQENAPEETQDAEGILWVGRHVEDEIAVPYLQTTVATEETYIRNSIWIDFTIDSGIGELRIKGVTDPVVVDDQSVPLLPTEIKTTSSLEYRQSPATHHRAQLHAYLVGLSEKYGKTLTDGVLIYISRETLELKSFHIEFDQNFWEDVVLDWTADHTEYRLNDDLPPAKPEQDWECGFCSYKERCGKGDSDYANYGPNGLLPDFKSYPREKVTEYLDSHEGSELTVALAEEFPELAEQYEVQSWHCPSCSATYTQNEVAGDGSSVQRPLCPACVSDDSIVELRPPLGREGAN